MNRQLDKTKSAIFVLFLIMGLNFLVAVFKIIVGTIANSTSIMADGFHSLSDGSGNIVGIVGLSIAGKPKDDDHPYGHKKFETISSMVIGMLLFSVGLKVLYSSVYNIIHPKTPEISVLSFIVMVTTLIVNIFVVKYEHSQGKKLSSEVLISDSEHTKSDVLITIGVIIAMGMMKIGFPPVIDGIVSLIICVFIFHVSFEIFSEATKTLTDSAVLDDNEIKELVMSIEDVKGCHNIRSRGRKDEVYVDMHILVEPNMYISKGHDIEHKIEDLLKEKYGDFVSSIVHIEPYKSL